MPLPSLPFSQTNLQPFYCNACFPVLFYFMKQLKNKKKKKCFV